MYLLSHLTFVQLVDYCVLVMLLGCCCEGLAKAGKKWDTIYRVLLSHIMKSFGGLDVIC